MSVQLHKPRQASTPRPAEPKLQPAAPVQIDPWYRRWWPQMLIGAAFGATMVGIGYGIGSLLAVW